MMFLQACPVRLKVTDASSCHRRGLPWNFQHIRQRIATSYQVCIGPGDDEYAAFYLNKDGNIQYSMSE